MTSCSPVSTLLAVLTIFLLAIMEIAPVHTYTVGTGNSGVLKLTVTDDR